MGEGEKIQRSITKYETPTMAIISAVEELKGVDQTELTPLRRILDPDCLNSIFTRTPVEALIQFEYEGCWVEVRADGTVIVSPLEERGEQP